MFPNFPRTKQNLQNGLMDFSEPGVRHLVGIIKDIPKKIVHEGMALSWNTKLGC